MHCVGARIADPRQTRNQLTKENRLINGTHLRFDGADQSSPAAAALTQSRSILISCKRHTLRKLTSTSFFFYPSSDNIYETILELARHEGAVGVLKAAKLQRVSPGPAPPRLARRGRAGMASDPRGTRVLQFSIVLAAVGRG